MEKTQIRTILGRNLKKYRNLRDLSQMEVAEKADISMNFLSEIERGKKWPYPETLQNLATALNLEVFELFRNEGDQNDIEEYKNLFSTDLVIAVDQAVKTAVNTLITKVSTTIIKPATSTNSNVMTASKSLPTTGEPNSVGRLNNPDGTPKQDRVYDTVLK